MCASVYAGLRRGQCARERRVDVPGDDDEIDLALAEDALDADERLCGLLGVGSRADAEELVRLREAELGEEDVRHHVVVVLAGVDEHELERGVQARQRAVHGRRLHEVRPGADDEADAGGHAGEPIGGVTTLGSCW